MTRIVSAERARANWADLLNDAQWRGQTTVITRRGYPAAQLAPVSRLRLWCICRTNADTVVGGVGNGFVIAAHDERTTRELAANQAHDEGRDVWLNPQRTSVTIIGTAYPDVIEGVLFSHAG